MPFGVGYDIADLAENFRIRTCYEHIRRAFDQAFEYPDDLRLCDGCWYRIVWTDSQGSRIRRGSEQIPGLCFVIGPCGNTAAGYQGKER